MKLFSDKELTQEVKDLDFGIVLAGDTKKIEYYLFNDTVADVVDLKASVNKVDGAEKDVEIVSCPETIKAKESAKIEFSWTPAVTLKKGLKTNLNLNFYELYE